MLQDTVFKLFSKIFFQIRKSAPNRCVLFVFLNKKSIDFLCFVRINFFKIKNVLTAHLFSVHLHSYKISNHVSSKKSIST
jgi:hypothetical protein